jgi:hypothetical protein
MLEKVKVTTEELFWSYVDVEGTLMPNITSRCWEWTASVGRQGYGRPNIKGKLEFAHRHAWEYHYGQKIPKGLEVHHLCNNKSCVNPLHAILLRSDQHKRLHSVIKTHCVNGHLFDNVNPLVDGDGYRRCRRCANEQRQRYEEKRRLKNDT